MTFNKYRINLYLEVWESLSFYLNIYIFCVVLILGIFVVGRVATGFSNMSDF